MKGLFSMNSLLMRGITLKFLYPVLMFAGAFSKSGRETCQRFIIDLNNKYVRRGKFRPGKILLLLPHCIQTNECDIRLTFNINNCKRCGRCGIRDLIQIAEDNRITLFVATGGSLARRIINDAKPEAIVAVACENDLSSGIADTYPLPVIGITNERPCGPCVNTRVDLSKVAEAIEFFGKGH